MRKFKILLAAVLTLALTACGAGVSEARADALNIVCTSFPCYDFARAVVGDAANIQLLIKPGAEVHSFEPTPADILAVAECDLFVYVGGESDVWVEDILDSFGGDAPRTMRFFDCVEALEEAEALEEEHDAGAEADHEYDEHIWTSPSNACIMVDALAERLCEIDPDGGEVYRRNAQEYGAQIARLGAEIRELVEGAKRRELIFADRFPFLYFVREYGLEYVAAFPSCSAESEPSAKTLMALIDRIVADEIPAVYVIELSSGKTAQALAEETGVEICTLYSMQNVSEADFSAGETYVSLMERNVEAFKEGLY